MRESTAIVALFVFATTLNLAADQSAPQQPPACPTEFRDVSGTMQRPTDAALRQFDAGFRSLVTEIGYVRTVEGVQAANCLTDDEMKQLVTWIINLRIADYEKVQAEELAEAASKRRTACGPMSTLRECHEHFREALERNP